MIKIVVDSGCDVTNEMLDSFDMDLIPLNLQLGNDIFVDDKNINVVEYVDKMLKTPEVPKTSAPSPETYMNSYKKGDSVFVVTLSSMLSGSFNSAMLAKQMYIDEIGNKFISIIDSLTASAGQTAIALKIQELIDKNLSDNEILEKINIFIKEMKTYVLLERYDNLIKTGRLNPTAAKIASMLNIKTICQAVNGEIAFLDKARGYNKAISKIVDIFLKDNVDYATKTLNISHVQCVEKALSFKNAILEKISFKNVIITEARGLSSTYANKDGIVISYF